MSPWVPRNRTDSEDERTVAMIPAPFTDGPAAGQWGEIPADADQKLPILRHVPDVGYALYRLDEGGALVFQHEVMPTAEAAAEWIARTAPPGARPEVTIHRDAEVPQARVVPQVRGRGEAG